MESQPGPGESSPGRALCAGASLGTAGGLGVVSVLAFFLAFRLETPTPEDESEVSDGFAAEV